jgi:hypothetical protein
MRIATVILLLAGVPTGACAQNTGSSIFVEGALFGDRNTSYRSPTELLTPGGGATIGGNLTSRLTFWFDVEIPTSHEDTYDDYCAGVFRGHSVTSRRAATYTALVGWHVLPRWQVVDLSLLAGFSAVAPESRYQGFVDTLAKDGSVVRHDEFNSSYSAIGGGVALGADVAVPLKAHLSVVPEVRFHIYSGDAITRPKVAIRWTF